MPVNIDDCWRRIGVGGDRSCPELGEMGHCRNCPRYSEAASRLLDRTPPEGHMEAAAELLAASVEPEDRGTLAVIVFRLAGEWLALPAGLFAGVSPLRPVCPIPHRTNNVLLGLVNVRGSLELCVSMAALVGVDVAADAAESPDTAGRHLLVIGRDDNRWAFAADEVCGIHRVAPRELLDVPTTAAKSVAATVKAVFAWLETHAGLLDDERLLENLRRSVQ